MSLNMKFIYASYIPFTHSLKIIFCNIFGNCVHETKFHGMGFSTFNVLSVLNSVCSLGVWIRNTQSVSSSLPVKSLSRAIKPQFCQNNIESDKKFSPFIFCIFSGCWDLNPVPHHARHILYHPTTFPACLSLKLQAHLFVETGVFK